MAFYNISTQVLVLSIVSDLMLNNTLWCWIYTMSCYAVIKPRFCYKFTVIIYSCTHVSWCFNARYILPYLKEETKTNPLVVRYISSFVWVQRFIYARMGYVNSNSLPKSTWDCVSRVDPTVGIEDILRNVFCEHAINRIADVLSSCYNYTEA